VTLHPVVLADLLATEADVARERLGRRVSALSVQGNLIVAVFSAHGRDWRLCLDGTHYDMLPLALSVIDENGHLQPREKWPPGLAYDQAPDHPVLHRPWSCLRGTLEYHMYPGHSADAWEFSRSDLRVADILDHLLEMRAIMTTYIAAGVLDAARYFFERRGTEGCEGTALIAGVPGQAASRLIIPDQKAVPAPYASVTITAAGELQLAMALPDSELYVARIHSHPGRAFHSQADHDNPVLTHEGALSIVVPWFGLGLRLGLGACAVYEHSRGIWTALPAGPERDDLVAVE